MTVCVMAFVDRCSVFEQYARGTDIARCDTPIQRRTLQTVLLIDISTASDHSFELSEAVMAAAVAITPCTFMQQHTPLAAPLTTPIRLLRLVPHIYTDTFDSIKNERRLRSQE